MGSILCEHCPAACCRHVALPIDKPTNKRDYNDIWWYLMHKDVSVFVEDGDWYIQFQAKCDNLRDDNLCAIYEIRPEICRDYAYGDCDYSGGDYGYDHLFTHPKQIEAYYKERTGKKLITAKPSRRRPGRKAKPA